MKIRILLLFLILACNITLLHAQENNDMPDLYTTNQDFFDPTRKEVVKEDYQFAALWSIEVGVTQPTHRTEDTTAMFLHGLRVGATVDLVLPYNFSIQTGALLTLSYGLNKQHWANVNAEDAQIHILNHNIIQLQANIPVRAYYNIKVQKKVHLFIYTGPQLNIGLTNYDIIKPNMPSSTLDWLQENGILTTSHDRYISKQLHRCNIQWGLGAGVKWSKYRIQAGYDFGLNNIIRNSVLPNQKMHEWGWLCTFSYKL